MTDTILIIEDNTDMLVNTSGILTLANYNVMTAENGKVGIELARSRTPDLVLCDIMMPVLDGYGVLQAFENIPQMAGIPFIFISGKTESSDFRTAMDLGADDYLPKPFSGNDLLRIVSARLKKSRQVKRSADSILGRNNFLDLAELKNSLKELISDRHIKKLRKKDMLFSEGDPCNNIHFLVSGKVKVFKSNEWGKEFIIDIYKENDFFGLTGFPEQGKHNESAMAIEDSEVALIPKSDLLTLLHGDSRLAMKFVKMISRDLASAENKLLTLAYDSARKRVAEAVISVSRKYSHNETDEISFVLLRENISGLSGISPESVSRIMTEFRQEGLLESNNGNIKVLNLKKLETLRY